MDVEIKKLEPKDHRLFNDLINVFEEVFKMNDLKIPTSQFLLQLLERDDFFVFVAKIDDQIVGGLTVYVLEQYYYLKPLAYIHDLAILEKYQRMGIGTKLISAVKQYCKERNFDEVFVQAEKEEQYAVDFYRSTKPSEELQVAHFGYKLGK